MKADSKTISNQVSEINKAAETCGVDPIAIHMAKYVLKTNDREAIYKWLKEKKGTTIGIIIALLMMVSSCEKQDIRPAHDISSRYPDVVCFDNKIDTLVRK